MTGEVSPEAHWAFRDSQARLARLLDTGTTTLLPSLPDPDRAKTSLLIAEARLTGGEGHIEGALALLEEAERLEPYDPKVSFERAEFLEESGRTTEAISAYRRALAIDPSVALVYYKIGMAYLSLGNRYKATFFLEQAIHRFNQEGPLSSRARREIERLTFPTVDEAGISDGIEAGDRPRFGSAREEFRSDDAQVVWWGRIAERYLPLRDRIQVRFTDPSGAVAQQQSVEKTRKPYVRSTLKLDADIAGRYGIWRVEALLDDRPIDDRTFRLTHAPQTR